MLKTRFFQYLIILSILIPSVSFSQIEKIKDYTVTKGDTLWDISGKELSDPFLWPKVWKENPDIKNPDKIYPDQSIKIPLYLLQKEAKEEPVPEPVVEEKPVQEVVKKAEPAPVKLRPLVDKNLLVSAGYIADSVSSLGTITGSPSGKNLFGNNDLIYVKPSASVNIGDRFYIIRADKAIKHPVTKAPTGYLVEMLGVAEISKFEYGETIAKILVSFRDIITGDLLDTYYDINLPIVTKPYRKPAVTGHIIATRNLALINGQFDIVYIDKGSNDGLEIGDILRTVDVGKHKVPNGTVQVISYQANTATAVVRQSTDVITAGNLITQAE